VPPLKGLVDGDHNALPIPFARLLWNLLWDFFIYTHLSCTHLPDKSKNVIPCRGVLRTRTSRRMNTKISLGRRGRCCMNVFMKVLRLTRTCGSMYSALGEVETGIFETAGDLCNE
jgi:hypothetical protein